jgi:hypothetical protein
VGDKQRPTEIMGLKEIQVSRIKRAGSGEREREIRRSIHRTREDTIARYRAISRDIARYRAISCDIVRYRTLSRDIARYRMMPARSPC